MRKSRYKKAFKAAFPKTIPVMAGYLFLGFGFGLLLQSKGYSFWWAILMCITIYGGSMQYVAVDLLSGGASLITTAIMTLMIHARHLFYGLSMLVKYRDVGKAKPYLLFGMTDETYSLVCTTEVPEGIHKNAYYFWITLLDQMYWIIGSTMGAVFGQFVNMNTAGVEFSMTSLFVVIITQNLLKQESRIPAIIGICVSLISLLIFGADNFLIPAMIGISIALIAFKPILSKNKEAE